MRFFNTAGPVVCSDHYCLPPLSRLNLPDILRLVEQKKYFVLHAPRQSGKTSCLLALADHLNNSGHYIALYINVEGAKIARNDLGRGIRAIILEIIRRNDISPFKIIISGFSKELLTPGNELSAIITFLSMISARSPLPFILLIDEVDSLIGDTFVSVLRQLRSGYDTRPASFPSTVILCGVPDVRDYRIQSDTEQMIITGGSAFNIKAESLTIGNFSQEEITTLCLQHTEETGQIFEPQALSCIWILTNGQPWLVNALANEVCFRMEPGIDRNNPVTETMILQAKENLIERRETHLDQLADTLKEDRVRRVIEPILTGELYEEMLRSDDIEYVRDLGLIIQKPNGEISLANRIYQEIIPRQLAWECQSGMAVRKAWFVDPDGKIRMLALIEAFQQFFRENAESWIERFQYKEAGPQILLQAFLQRIINGGGRIDREYGLGMRRTDLFVHWPQPNGSTQRIIIELKILHGSREETIRSGIAQTWRYAYQCGADEAHLIIFDRREGKSWEEKVFNEIRVYEGTGNLSFPVTVWGM